MSIKFSRHIYWLFFFLFLSLSFKQALALPPALSISASQQYEFAEFLFRNGQYLRAAEEFERFVFFFPTDERYRNAEFKMAEAFRLSGDYTAAIRTFQKLTKMKDDGLDYIAVESYFRMAESYLSLGSANQALLQLHNLLQLSEDIRTTDRAYYRIGWIAVSNADWDNARRVWGRISDHGHLPKDRLIAALEQSAQIPRKSPTVAGSLSIVPGLGQIYLGRYQDAAVALIISGGTLWAAYEAFDKDLPVLGAMLTLVGAGFYTGNIYSAVSGAHKYNRRQNEQFYEQLSLTFEPSSSCLLGQFKHDTYVGLHIKIAF
jgi:TolA-binding protein